MSRGARAALSVSLSVALGGAAQAQNRAALEQHIVSLAKQYVSADSAVRAYDDSIARLNSALDTATAGAFRLTTSRRIAPLARAAADKADRGLRDLFGASTTRLSSYRFVIRDSRNRGKLDTSRVEIALSDSTGREVLSGAANAEVEAVSRYLSSLALNRLTRTAGPDFNAWLQAQLPMDTMTAAEWSKARLVVVSTWASVGKGCYDGRAHDCGALVALESTNDPVMDWFDPRMRREAVRQHLRAFDNRSETRSECLGGDDASCATMLHRAGFNPLPIPLRGSLVRQALALGGTGAYERLVEANGDVPTRLAAAARVPADSVVRAWQSNIRFTRVPSDAMRSSIAAASLGWIVLCVGLSLRSSRWR